MKFSASSKPETVQEETDLERLLRLPLVLSWLQEPESPPPVEVEDDWTYVPSVAFAGLVCTFCGAVVPLMWSAWRATDGRIICGIEPVPRHVSLRHINVCLGSRRGRAHTHRTTAAALHGKVCR